MSTLKSLNHLIGAQALGDHLTAAVQDLVDREQLDRTTAYQRITDAADAGDVAVLAATRQMWVRREDIDPEEAPARRLYVLERTDTGVFVAYLGIDQAADETDDGEHANVVPELLPYNDHSLGAELPVEVLEMYRLEAWEPFELLLPTVGGIDNVRPQGGAEVMTTAPPRPSVTACRQCAGRPATVLETVSASRHDNARIADQLADELGNGAHTHADRDGDMHVVRPIGTSS